MTAQDAATAVKTAARTLDVFEAFRAASGPLSLTELSDRTGVPISSCHALVRTLQARGYLYMLDNRRRFYPTKRLLEVAGDIARNDPLLERIAPVLEELRNTTGETVVLGKRQNDEIVFLEVIEGNREIRYTALPGDTKPLHSASIGKALLGQCNEHEIREVLARNPLEAHTSTTITDVDRLVAELMHAAARGYFVTRGENVPEVMGIAVPLRVAGELFGLALGGPVMRMEPQIQQHIAALSECVRRLAELS
jgi:IclR family acetate operon transcriptional repressor